MAHNEYEACEYTAYCPFFNDKMADMPAMAAAMKMRFCETNFTSCARYMVMLALGPDHIPDNLFPSNIEQAHHITAMAETAG